MNNKVQPISEVKESGNERSNAFGKEQNGAADKVTDSEEDIYVEYDDVYEEYNPRYQEYITEKFYKKIGGFFKRKLWLFYMILVLLGAIVVGLAIYLIKIDQWKQTKPIEPVVEEVVLMLSYTSNYISNAPMLIGINGEFFQISFKAPLMN